MKRKLFPAQLQEIHELRKEFGLSLYQCCRWLERRRGVSISRTTLYRRLEALQDQEQPVHISDILQSYLESIGSAGDSR